MIAHKVEALLPAEYSKTQQFQSSVLSSGRAELDAVLPDAGFPRGQVIELSMTPGAGLGTSLALWVCSAAQREAERQGSTAWCAFIDPFASLYAPAVMEAGVDLGRLLVARPSLAALSRVAVRLAEANAFAVVVIDTLGCLHEADSQEGAEKPVPPAHPVQKSTPKNAEGIGSQHWIRAVRRLALAIQSTHTQVFLLTDKDRPRGLPLPVGLRLELTRTAPDTLQVKVTKDKRGRINEGRVVQLACTAQLRKTRPRKLAIQPVQTVQSKSERQAGIHTRLSLVPDESSLLNNTLRDTVPLKPIQKETLSHLSPKRDAQAVSPQIALF